jgi:CRISP-associated protein Cas1
MNLLGVHSLHALAYCERLFYLENVEMIRLADARGYAGRTLHVEIARELFTRGSVPRRQTESGRR